MRVRCSARRSPPPPSWYLRISQILAGGARANRPKIHRAFRRTGEGRTRKRCGARRRRAKAPARHGAYVLSTESHLETFQRLAAPVLVRTRRALCLSSPFALLLITAWRALRCIYFRRCASGARLWWCGGVCARGFRARPLSECTALPNTIPVAVHMNAEHNQRYRVGTAAVWWYALAPLSE